MGMRVFTLLLLIVMLMAPDALEAQSIATCVGAKVSRDLDSNTTPQFVGAGRKILCGYYFENAGTAKRYLKLYNKATSPTVGTDTPVLTLPIPAGGAGHVAFPGGIDEFDLGLAFATTTGKVDNDTGVPTANDVTVNLVYR